MTYAYIRVSSDKQTLENQRYEIMQYCLQHQITIDRWYQEVITGTKSVNDRRLGNLLRRIKHDDLIISTEISRFGRSLYMVLDFFGKCLDKGCRIYTIKDGFQLGDNLQSKVIAFALSLSAEVERLLISQRTKEALAYRKSQGVQLGRPSGFENSPVQQKLYANMDLIREQLRSGVSRATIARQLQIGTTSLYKFVQSHQEVLTGRD